MGMFDRIQHADPRICCTKGHMLGELQTKDLDCELTNYAIRPDGMFWWEGGGWRHPRSMFMPVIAAGVSGTLRAYTGCETCERAGVGILDAWCEFDLAFEKGRLVSVTRAAAD